MGKIKQFLRFILNSYAIRSLLPYSVRRALNLVDEAIDANERRSARKNVQDRNPEQVKKDPAESSDNSGEGQKVQKN